MTVVLGLLAFLLVLNVAALSGWAPNTSDGRDWQLGSRTPTRGPVHLPTEWAAPIERDDADFQMRHVSRHGMVETYEPDTPRSGVPSSSHAAAA